MEASGGGFVSPNEMLEQAKKLMLNGREPVSDHDWCLVVNFVAKNVASGTEEVVCRFFKMLYSIPLPNCDVDAIAHFQAVRKTAKYNQGD